MTVTIKQRVPDKKTQEQHIYIKYDVVMVTTTRDGVGGEYIKLVNKLGQQSSYPLYFFDFEIH